MRSLLDELHAADYEAIARRLMTIIVSARRFVLAHLSAVCVSLLVVIVALAAAAAMWWRLRARRKRSGM